MTLEQFLIDGCKWLQVSPILHLIAILNVHPLLSNMCCQIKVFDTLLMSTKQMFMVWHEPHLQYISPFKPLCFCIQYSMWRTVDRQMLHLCQRTFHCLFLNRNLCLRVIHSWTISLSWAMRVTYIMVAEPYSIQSVWPTQFIGQEVGTYFIAATFYHSTPKYCKYSPMWE